MEADGRGVVAAAVAVVEPAVGIWVAVGSWGAVVTEGTAAEGSPDAATAAVEAVVEALVGLEA